MGRGDSAARGRAGPGSGPSAGPPRPTAPRRPRPAGGPPGIRGQALALPLGLLGGAEVAEVSREERRLAGDAGDRQFHRDFRPVGAEGGHLDPLAQQGAFARGEEAGQSPVVVGPQPRRHNQTGQVLAHGVGAGVAERPLGRLVEIDDPPLVVDGDDRVQGGLQDRRLARLRAAAPPRCGVAPASPRPGASCGTARRTPPPWRGERPAEPA